MKVKHQEPVTGASKKSTSYVRGRPRAGKGWWFVASVAVVAGSVGGVTVSYLARPNGSPHTTSNKIFTSTGGVFQKEHGQKAVSWSLPSLRTPSGTVSLSQYRGHPLVLNFWASWCAPCRKEMPALAATARRYSGKVSFVGIDTSDARGAGLNFASKTGVRYGLAFDPNASVAGSYAVYGLPTTFFISKDGRLLGRQVGALTAGRLEQLIGQTFGVPAPTGAAGAVRHTPSPG